MQKNNLASTAVSPPRLMGAGKPSVILTGRHPVIERKTFDPSSSSPRGERYPIPSFFEYRIRPKDYDPL